MKIHLDSETILLAKNQQENLDYVNNDREKIAVRQINKLKELIWKCSHPFHYLEWEGKGRAGNL